MRLRALIFTLGVLLLSPVAHAQTYNTVTPAPSVSAADRQWYVDRSPILFAGFLYYPAGAKYHFDPDVMVETGAYDGIPLYADTSVAPYDEVLVPIGGGLVQPYERRRAGQWAGTTGSHAPDFPVDVTPWETPATRSEPAPAGAMQRPGGETLQPWRPDTEEARLRLLQPPGRIQTIREPQDNRGIWIQYEGQRWNAAGRAVAFEASAFSQIGQYFGFPVFSARGTEEIFIPASHGMVAAYRKDSVQ